MPAQASVLFYVFYYFFKCPLGKKIVVKIWPVTLAVLLWWLYASMFHPLTTHYLRLHPLLLLFSSCEKTWRFVSFSPTVLLCILPTWEIFSPTTSHCQSKPSLSLESGSKIVNAEEWLCVHSLPAVLPQWWMLLVSGKAKHIPPQWTCVFHVLLFSFLVPNTFDPLFS